MDPMELLRTLRIDRETRRSAFLDDLQLALQECKDAVADTGKAASVSVKLTFRPLSKDGVMIECRDEITTRCGKPAIETTMLFANADGFSRRDERQLEMQGLRPVDDRRAG